MRTYLMTFTMVLFFATAASAQLTPAQEAAIANKSIVTVVVGDGTWKGRLMDLTTDSVTIQPDGWPAKTLPIATVLRIETKKRDSIANGALTGAAVLGLLCLLNCGQGLDSADELPGVVVMNAITGAVIGAVIDARHTATMPIYKRPAPQERRPGLFFTVRF